MSSELLQKEKSIQFYDDRYQSGYMDDWPNSKKERVKEIIRGLPLPQSGIAIDFGCGSGVFTEVLQQALPGWSIYGCDISTQAIELAKQRFPACTFFVSGDPVFANLKFDFLLSHHVLEHVYDLQKTTDEVNNLLKPHAAMLHIFPCGNQGSFEYTICAVRTDGINPELGNRFFFEDIGHLRRLTTSQTAEALAGYGFGLSAEFYSNQFFGALQWLSEYDKGFLLDFTDPSKSKDQAASGDLIKWRKKLLAYRADRFFVQQHSYLSLFRSVVFYIKALVKHAWYLFYLPLARYRIRRLDRQAAEEWSSRRTDPRGSEMYLFFTRPAAGSSDTAKTTTL